MHFISMSCIIVLSRTASSILNRNSENRQFSFSFLCVFWVCYLLSSLNLWFYSFNQIWKYLVIVSSNIFGFLLSSMLTALQPPRKRLPSGRKMVWRGVSSSQRRTLPSFACRKRVWQKAAPFSCRENAVSLWLDTVVLPSATDRHRQLRAFFHLSVFSPVSGDVHSRSFQRDLPFPFSPPTEFAAMLPSAHLPRSIASGTNILWVCEIAGFSVILICHGKMQIRIRIKKSWEWVTRRCLLIKFVKIQSKKLSAGIQQLHLLSERFSLGRMRLIGCLVTFHKRSLVN